MRLIMSNQGVEGRECEVSYQRVETGGYNGVQKKKMGAKYEVWKKRMKGRIDSGEGKREGIQKGQTGLAMVDDQGW